MQTNNVNRPTNYGGNRESNNRGQSNTESQVITNQDSEKIFSENDRDGTTLFEKANGLANATKEDKDTQIRRIYTEFGRIYRIIKAELKTNPTNALDKSKYLLKHLKARLAYTKARDKDMNVFCNNFTAVIDAAISKGPVNRIYENGDLVIDRLKDFFEATLAYYKQRSANPENN